MSGWNPSDSCKFDWLREQAVFSRYLTTIKESYILKSFYTDFIIFKCEKRKLAQNVIQYLLYTWISRHWFYFTRSTNSRDVCDGLYADEIFLVILKTIENVNLIFRDFLCHVFVSCSISNDVFYNFLITRQIPLFPGYFQIIFPRWNYYYVYWSWNTNKRIYNFI